LADIALDDTEYSTLSHGVNTDVPGESNKANAMRAFGFDPDDDVIAIPGFIRPPKGHDIFIELARELPEYEFMIAGGARAKGEDFEFAEQIREEAPENVTITGVLDRKSTGRRWPRPTWLYFPIASLVRRHVQLLCDPGTAGVGQRR